MHSNQKTVAIGVIVFCVSGQGVFAGPLPSTAKADYQLGGAYSPAEGVNVVVRDSAESPAVGLFNICYVNGFQSQAGSNWPKSLVVRKNDGAYLFDPNWPDEFLLDISTDKKRNANLELL
ncbi:MAG: endo alpha-1,4 polygalactosaminidase, partial [Alphaproteobacteria bacterium]|nr:endo alpha-1,4 polygalactosaminidase [Alphaproteobacteria bacterium]